MKTRTDRITVFLVVLSTLLLVTACKQQPSQAVFDTPEAAIAALADLIGQNDEQRLEQLFGPGSADLFQSGDEFADREDYMRVGAMIREDVEFREFDANTQIALLGDEAWPWPIPLVKEAEGWRFDTAEGREELLNRRIGRNELWTLTTLHEVVEAQREYRSEPRDGNPPAFAQQFRSSEGKHDGLYWPTADGEERSPLGELLAESEAREAEAQPFSGYFYRVLTRRGPGAPGGEKDYLDDDGLLTKGFAVVAWPAKYGNSGVMTFIVNHRGLVFQKDLGPDTTEIASAIDGYEPDISWLPTGDSLGGIAE